jgi:hypothetical protein
MPPHLSDRTIKEIKSIINLARKNPPGPDWFTGEFSQTFEKEMIHSFLQKTEAEETLSNSLYEANITLTPKQEYIKTLETYRPIYLLNTDAKILHKISNWSQQYVENIIYLDQVGFIPGTQSILFLF